MVVKALARDAEPDHDTIAHFISSQAPAVKDLFAQVLLKCYALDLVGGELFAIDGCKLPSNASKEWSWTLTELGKKKNPVLRIAMTYNKKMDRFSLRGKKKVNIQWLLYCMVHNIGKCIPGILAESGG
jgi:hypothetical protein